MAGSKKPKRKPKDESPDALKRQPDGRYLSADGRFAVEQANGSWFVADHETADDFGQPRVAGPFATLVRVKDAIPRVRSGPTALRRPIKQPMAKAKARPTVAPPPKPETWLDRLSADDRRRAERLVHALERVGIGDAEGLAQVHITGGRGAADLARRLLRARVDRVLNEADADEHARELVADVLRAVTVDGEQTGPDLPGWALFALESDGSVTDRRVELD